MALTVSLTCQAALADDRETLKNIVSELNPKCGVPPLPDPHVSKSKLAAAFSDPEEALWEYIEAHATPNLEEVPDPHQVAGAFHVLLKCGLVTKKSLDRSRTLLQEWQPKVDEIQEYPAEIEQYAANGVEEVSLEFGTDLTKEGQAIYYANRRRNELIHGCLEMLYYHGSTPDDRGLAKPFASARCNKIRRIAIAIFTGADLQDIQ